MIQGIRVLPLVEVSLVLSLSPLFTAVLAYFILKDRLTLFEITCLMFSFGGVITIILGKADITSKQN